MCVTGLQCHAVTQTNTPTMPFIELSKTQQWANTHTDWTLIYDTRIQTALKSLSFMLLTIYPILLMVWMTDIVFMFLFQSIMCVCLLVYFLVDVFENWNIKPLIL